MTTNVTDYITKDIFRIIKDTAESMGVNAYVVGEYVRDCYLDRSNNQIEIVVEGDGLEFGRIVGNATRSIATFFKNKGVSIIKYRGDKISFSTAKKIPFVRDKGKQGYVPGTIIDDLSLRDFTINSLAISLNQSDYGCLIDLFDGISDITQGIVRTISSPEKIIFDNPIVILRAIRLVTQLSTFKHKFNIESGFSVAIWKYADKVDLIDKERVTDELNKILLCDEPSPGFKLLDELRILIRIIPELSATKGVEKVDGVGHEDSFRHSLLVVDNIAKLEVEQTSGTTNSLGIKLGEPNLWLRWAALLHEIGKPNTKRYIQGKGWTFHGYDYLSAKMIAKVFATLKMPHDEKLKYVQKLVMLQNRPKILLEEKTSESAYRRLLLDAGDDISDLILLCQANVTTTNKTKANKEYEEIRRVEHQLIFVLEKDAIRNFKIPIDANYIMDLYGLKPCKELSILKSIIKDAILDGIIGNTFEEADALLRKEAAGMGLKLKKETIAVPETPPVNLSSANEKFNEPLSEELIDVEEEKTPLDEAIESINAATVSEIKQAEDYYQPEKNIIEDHVPAPPTPNAHFTEIINAFKEKGISKLFLITNEEEFNSIQGDQALVKDIFFLFTHKNVDVIRRDTLIALEIDLQVLTMPRAIISFEENISKGISNGTELSNVHLINQDEATLFLYANGKEQPHDLSRSVIIIQNRIPIDYIINYKTISEEYSDSLPF